jgi:putative membrane protein
MAETSTYCGPPPVPGTLAWNFDPALIAPLVLTLVAYEIAAHRGGLAAYRRRAFRAGWACAALALVSPLCGLGVALFSARVAQHLTLALVAAPLVAVGAPATFRTIANAARPSQEPAAADRLGAWAAFAACLWLWHLPTPYAATLRSTAVYWTAHISLFWSAVWLWRVLTRPDGAGGMLNLALAAATTMHMGLLGALLTFAPAPLFASHVTTAPAWGVTALVDQQIAGLLCWIPGCAVFLAASVAAAARILAASPVPRPAAS